MTIGALVPVLQVCIPRHLGVNQIFLWVVEKRKYLPRRLDYDRILHLLHHCPILSKQCLRQQRYIHQYQIVIYRQILDHQSLLLALNSVMNKAKVRKMLMHKCQRVGR